MSEDVDTIEQFYGVYLLYCTNPKYKGRTYIGYTVDPNRRIKQHNKGKKAGGAWKTSNKGPWIMALIIHGFPNDIAALRFEWAWQHPNRSRRLNHVPKKKSRELTYNYCLRVLSEMLRVGPWNRLPLTIRWLNEEYVRDFPCDKLPPMHMPICFGPVVSKKLPNSQKVLEDNVGRKSDSICTICLKEVEDKSLSCLNIKCDLKSHIICLATYFCNKGQYIPIEGNCPQCNNTFLWGDIVRKYKGCYGNMNAIINTELDDDDLFSTDTE